MCVSPQKHQKQRDQRVSSMMNQLQWQRNCSIGQALPHNDNDRALEDCAAPMHEDKDVAPILVLFDVTDEVIAATVMLVQVSQLACLFALLSSIVRRL
jgi:hypothetical protein